ncbi:MAG: YebC/PmpR family DNA-binding transcriptional regulator [Candidatus Krumholzibacteria bacterium]|nr:YebC/PmpR family DNA-binding transcriptional regulator [Candidatus Krumholzibacteria bacterium]
MSGHSKWATIKRKKAKVDAQRGKIFTKLIREILTSAREGGGDQENNARLRTAVQSARESNMPYENIERAIKRGTGELDGVSYETATFEGYAPGGIAILVITLTDNRNRTSSEIRHLFTRHGGHMTEPNSVSYMFEKKGVIVVEGTQTSEDKLFELALDNGADDVRSEGGSFEIVCPPDAFESLRAKLQEAKIPYQMAELALYPKTAVKLERDAAVKVLKLVSSLEDLDDVQNVAGNFDISDEILKAIEGELG